MTHEQWLTAHGFTRDGYQWIRGKLAVEICGHECTAEYDNFDLIGVGENPKIALLDLAELLSAAACVALGATQSRAPNGAVVGTALEPAKRGETFKMRLGR